MSTFYVVAEVTMRPYFMEGEFHVTHDSALNALRELPDNGNWDVYAIAGKPPDGDGPYGDGPYEVVERPGRTGVFRNGELRKWCPK